MKELALIDGNCIIKDEAGNAVLSDIVEQNLDIIRDYLDKANALDDEFRSKLLDSMIAADCYSAKIGKYTVSVAMPKDKVLFDVDSFVENESDDMLGAFCKFNESKTFNLEKFKAEHPDIYAQYEETSTDVEVDQKKLESAMPNVYEKYVSRVVSDKKPVLKISQRKA